MAIVDRIDINKKRPAPPWIKMILLIAVLFGIYVRGCWIKNQSAQIFISDVFIQEFTTASIDVAFTIENKTGMKLNKNIIIKVNSDSGEEISSRITSVTLVPYSKKKHIKVLQKLNRPIREQADVAKVTVELFIPTILKN
jgi:hypothetical protein